MILTNEMLEAAFRFRSICLCSLFACRMVRRAIVV